MFIQGTVQAAMTTINPANQTELDSAPGDFSTVDDEGEAQSLQTYGKLSIHSPASGVAYTAVHNMH